jgi:hypothetical protein
MFALLTSLVIFISFEGLIVLYFAPRAILLLNGRDLNAQFEVVRIDKSDRVSRGISVSMEHIEDMITATSNDSMKPNVVKRSSLPSPFGYKIYPLNSSLRNKWKDNNESLTQRKLFTDTYCRNMPNTIDEAERVIRHYKAHVMQMTQEATNII